VGDAVIETLRIQGLALVDLALLEFGPGLNVVTGETGAGKSLVLGALALAAGARGAADSVRDGAEEAVVEAVFSTAALPELETELSQRGVDVHDHALVVRRTLAQGGRSRAQLAGQLVPVAALGELFAGRIEISSQHESQALLKPETHGRLLDAFGDLLPLRAEVATEFSALRALDDEISGLEHAAAERARRQDFLAYQVREIDEAKPVRGEGSALSAERARLVHAERLGAETGAAAGCLTGDPSQADVASASDLLAEAMRRVDVAARLDPSLGPLLERLRGAHAETTDLAGELERYAGAIEADAGRLADLESRLAQLEALRRKYGGTEEAVLAFRDEAAEQLAQVAGAEERTAEATRERAARAARLAARAQELGRGRVLAAARLGTALEAALRELGMATARIEVALPKVEPPPGLPCGPSGAEAPELRFCANPGEPARPLRRVASGGELSRVFLALKNVLRRADAGMVLVFDEVDAGIGGPTADRVGRVLAELAAEHQVLCITHLPQIAARGATHFRVAKHQRGGRTCVDVERLDEAGRVEEIARMAGGEKVTEATRRHARELLAGARGGGVKARGRRSDP